MTGFVRRGAVRQTAQKLSWVERLRAIPDDCRDFVIDASHAERDFGIDAGLMRKLISQGMPYVRNNDGPCFTAMDLHYVGVRLGCAEIYLDAMHRWADALTVSTASDMVEVEVRYIAYASPGTAIRVLEPHGWETVTLGQDRAATTVTTTIAGQWPSLDHTLDALLTEIASLDFCRLPDSLATNTDFIRETRLADCAGASKLLVEECRSRGVRARTAYGLLLACPYSTTHNWAEIEVGQDWVPADPLLLALLARYASLDTTAWPATRAPGGVLLRLAEESTPLSFADGRAVDTTFLTTIRPMQGSNPVVELQRSAP
jgi:hypothetical protein